MNKGSNVLIYSTVYTDIKLKKKLKIKIRVETLS